MSVMSMNGTDARIPTEAESRFAEESSRKMATIKPKVKKSLGIKVETEDGTEFVPIPDSLFQLLMDLLTNMALGNAVTLVPLHAELTTQQSADLLNVSRPYVIQLVETNQLPHKMVGTHRRILFSDLMDYKRRNDAPRLKVLVELTKQAQELGLGY